MFAEASSLAWLKAKLAGIWRTISTILSAIGLIELSIEQLTQNNKDYQNSIDNTESTIASMQTSLNIANNVRRGLEGYIRSAQNKIDAAEAEGDQDAVDNWTRKRDIALRRFSVAMNEVNTILHGINMYQSRITQWQRLIDANKKKIKDKEDEKRRKQQQYEDTMDDANEIQRQINEYEGNEDN